VTWIRFECATPDDPLWAELAEAAGCDVATAFLSYWTMLARLAKTHPSGQLDQVTDEQLERWAGWRRRRGRWAAAIRTRCQEPAASPRAGMLRGWWRNLAPLEKQARDAKKRHVGRSENARKIRGETGPDFRHTATAAPDAVHEVNTKSGKQMRDSTRQKPARVSPENPPKTRAGFTRHTVDIQDSSTGVSPMEGATRAAEPRVAPLVQTLADRFRPPAIAGGGR
jgi:hypothetical protein